MTRLRSLLFVPGNIAGMLAKAEQANADVLVPDMEDSVPDAEKANARATMAACLPRLAAGRALVVPRVNSLATGWIEQDLEAVVGPHISGISVGKIDDAGDLSMVSNLLTKLEGRAGIAAGRLKLIPWIETARAIVHCYEICTASQRIVGAAFGAEDYTHDLGIERRDDESQLAYARATLCTAARAAGVAALDTPYFKFRDLDGLRSTSLAAKDLGFRGRFAIHPDQVATINECFSPSAAEIEHARRVVAAFEEAEQQGRGSTSLDGRVIDVPVVKRARALLASLDPSL
jgi:citrate lyase subunit beta/citryl-CoA lyase